MAARIKSTSQMLNNSPPAFQFILGGEEGRALVEEREREDWDKFSHISTRSRAAAERRQL